MSGRILDELIDLTTMRPSKASRAGFTPTDLMWIVIVGAVPYLAREAFRYFLPTRPTVADQLKVLAELIAAGDAKAKSLQNYLPLVQGASKGEEWEQAREMTGDRPSIIFHSSASSITGGEGKNQRAIRRAFIGYQKCSPPPLRPGSPSCSPSSNSQRGGSTRSD